MTEAPFRYRSSDEDSARWLDFPFRDGDIVISTRSKSGTTWMQMICALLVLGTPELPAPLARLSPWLDWLVEPRDEVFGRLAAQPHRRFIKTHTPLDGVPIDPRVSYVVVARHPLDAAVSLWLREWLPQWIDQDVDPRDELDSLPGVLWHLTDAWARRDQPNVILVHYDDLRADLAGQMRRLADRLGVTVPERRWPELVEAATFTRMRARAEDLAPDPSGVFRDRKAFFRRGGSGQGRELLAEAELARYQARTAALAPPDLLAWLHREG
jgi:hypothetical protein